jgi:hypothetical protein
LSFLSFKNLFPTLQKKITQASAFQNFTSVCPFDYEVFYFYFLSIFESISFYYEGLFSFLKFVYF